MDRAPVQCSGGHAGYIPVRDSDFFFVLCLCLVDHFSHFPCFFFHQFACSVKTKSLFLKMSQIYVVLLKEKMHIYLTIGFGEADLSVTIFPSNCKDRRKTVLSIFSGRLIAELQFKILF